MKLSTNERIVVATHNRGKLEEFKKLLHPYVKEFVSLKDLGLDAPEETGSTFSENALLKAKAAALTSGYMALADDSGLCVSALGHKPGIYSARWAGVDENFLLAIERVQLELGASSDRSARFVCALALAWPDGTHISVEGHIEGTLSPISRGGHGFGYDPIFIPNGFDKTFAEMQPAVKNAISHRSVAVQKLIKKVFTPNAPAQPGA